MVALALEVVAAVEALEVVAAEVTPEPEAQLDQEAPVKRKPKLSSDCRVSEHLLAECCRAARKYLAAITDSIRSHEEHRPEAYWGPALAQTWEEQPEM